MKIRVLSDIHAEFGPINLLEGDEDVIVLAGDTTTGSPVEWASRFRKPVIVICGNHEFYHDSYEQVLAMSRTNRHSNVFFLEQDIVTIDGVTFAGLCLWSHAGHDVERHAWYRRCMSDYQAIRYQKRLLTAEDTTRFHQESVAWLSGLSGIDVVVSHHMPSFRSVSPRFVGNPLNPLYVTDLDSLILKMNPKVWVHGHTHDSFDYTIGNTRVVCNPRGYYPYELNKNFDENLIVEI